MPSRKGRRVVVASAALAAAVIAALLIVGWGEIREAWLLHRLRSQDPKARKDAGDRLAAMGSLRAVPFLAEELLAASPGDPGPDPRSALLGRIVKARGPAAAARLAPLLDRSPAPLKITFAGLVLEGDPGNEAARRALHRVIRAGGLPDRENGSLLFTRAVHSIEKRGGEEPIAVLTGVLREGGESERGWAVEGLGRLEASEEILKEALRDPAPAVRLSAAEALANRADAAVILPTLLEILRAGGDLEGRALDLFARIAGDSIQALVEGLRIPRDAVRIKCADLIAEIGPEAAEAEALLREALKDPAGEVRTSAAAALFEIGAPRGDCLPALLDGISRGWDGSGMADSTIYEIAMEDPSVVETIARLLGPADRSARFTILRVLLWIAHAGAPVPVEPLRKVLADPEDPQSALTAARVLAEGKAALGDAIPVLLRSMEKLPDLLGGEAQITLERLGPAAAPAVPRLLEDLQSLDWEIRAGAASVLGKAGRGAPGVVPALLAALGDDQEMVRRAAVYSLAELGPDAAPALPEIEKILGDGEPGLDAAGAIAAIEPRRREEMLALIRKSLGDKAYMPRDRTIRLLGLLGPAARAAVTDLLDLALSQDRGSRFAAGALGAIGIEDFGPLEKALADEEPFTRERAAEILGEVGRIPPTLIPPIVRALEDPDEGVREAAARALAKVGPDARSAVPALRALARGRWRSLRAAAREALRAIEGR